MIEHPKSVENALVGKITWTSVSQRRELRGTDIITMTAFWPLGLRCIAVYATL